MVPTDVPVERRVGEGHYLQALQRCGHLDWSGTGILSGGDHVKSFLLITSPVPVAASAGYFFATARAQPSLRQRRDAPSDELLENLDLIRRSFRNPTAHPEKSYDIDEAQDLFGLCIDVVNRMAREL